MRFFRWLDAVMTENIYVHGRHLTDNAPQPPARHNLPPRARVPALHRG
jgi:hypothetical protein